MAGHCAGQRLFPSIAAANVWARHTKSFFNKIDPLWSLQPGQNLHRRKAHDFYICHVTAICLKIIQAIGNGVIKRLIDRCQSDVRNPTANFIMRMHYARWKRSGNHRVEL